jgi:hypothetical protein
VAARVVMRHRRWVAVPALMAGITACGGAAKSTAPQQTVTTACAPSGTITLSALQGTTVDCSNGGNGFTLAGNGATYLVVPEFATGDVGYSFQPFSLGRRGAPTGSPASTMSRPVSAGQLFGRMPSSNRRQATFDLRLRAADRKRASALGALTAARAFRVPAPIKTRGGPAPVRSFRVVADSTGTTYKTSVAKLAYTGTYVYVYLDTLAPKSPNGFSPSQLTQFGQYADQVLYPLDLNTFGPPTDIDNNGHLIMLLTPIVNGLTPKSECVTQGFVAGFFNGLDLDAPSDPNSNNGEIFYQLVPDSAGTFSCGHSVSEVESITPGTFLHELQHMISNGQHVIIAGGQPEEGWLDEGESIVATELGARFYDAKYPPPSGRTDPTQLFPDSAEPFISEQLYDSYTWLTDPDTASVTLHSDADCCLAWRAGDWLLMRYVGDQYDSTVFARLDQSNLTGTANLAHATGVPFAQMFANFGLALYTDSIPNVPRTSVPAINRYKSYNLRQLYQRLYDSCQPNGCNDGIDNPFPFSTQPLTTSSTLSGSMVPGTVSFYQLTTPSGSATVNVVFGPPTGSGSLQSGLHPQVAVFRIQ